MESNINITISLPLIITSTVCELSSAIQHATPKGFDGKCGMEVSE